MTIALNIIVDNETLDAVKSGRQTEVYVDGGHRQAKYFYLYERQRTTPRERPAVAVVRQGGRFDCPALAVEVLGVDRRGKAETLHSEWGEPCEGPHYAVNVGKVLFAGTVSEVHRWTLEN